jgi:hypothetical protein
VIEECRGLINHLSLYEANYVGMTDIINCGAGRSEVWIRCGSLANSLKDSNIDCNNIEIKIVLLLKCDRTEAYLSKRVPGAINREASTEKSELLYVISFGATLRSVHFRAEASALPVSPELYRLIPKGTNRLQELLQSEFAKPDADRDVDELCRKIEELLC